MHIYYIMIKSSQKFWVVYVHYRFIPEQCGFSEKILIFNICRCGLMPNLIKKSWMVSNYNGAQTVHYFHTFVSK